MESQNWENFIINSPDNQVLSARKYNPDAPAEAVVIIVHGMAEHQKRYAEIAEELRSNFFTVYTYDQRGHGDTAGNQENIGFFAPKNGHKIVVNDLELLVQIAKKEVPGKPIFLMGHSMGSFVCRNYILTHSEEIDGLILSGTAAGAGFLGKIGRFIASVTALIMGKRHPSRLMDALSFGDFNKSFKPNRTKFDWLSKDHTAVDKYIEDPYCGSIFSAQFFKDMLKLIEQANSTSKAQSVSNKEMPVLLISGDNDPVGDFGKGVKKVRDMYREAGFTDVEMILYPEGRHEMLNETNKSEVYTDLIDRLERKTQAMQENTPT
jgi:alpha-beta hydrolase superfamily lysophospholipase